ncbi:MarR family winged helix-turn-helix transcriptional regulator [Variovorax paradoxus]|uniref:MarR family winged helix-turn-helix transcriptional regulator n=1 Tax=Variovorax paradoxus TaxID=34073 RepID=UPI0013EEC9DC|nr:MarR family transcriptional regulator [Variovorax paradoxus]
MPAHLHDTLPFLLNRIAARITEAVNREFRPLGLNVFSGRVLTLLYLDEASTVGELAEKAALDQSTLSHILRRLQADGLLRKERLDHDNRSVMVLLTERGQEAAALCWDAIQTHDAMIRKGLDSANVKVLKHLLVRMYDNVPAFKGRALEVGEGTESRKAVARKRPTPGPH